VSGDLHRELVARACSWLRNTRKCPVVFAEPTSMKLNEMPDAIGYRFGYYQQGTTVVEVKTSIADFKRDADKRWKRIGEGLGMGRFRFYLVPALLLNPSDVPEDHGLIYSIPGEKLRIVKSAPDRKDARDIKAELTLAVNMLQRHQLGVPWFPKEYRFETMAAGRERAAKEQG
jgi:hypothetical protein